MNIYTLSNKEQNELNTSNINDLIIDCEGKVLNDDELFTVVEGIIGQQIVTVTHSDGTKERFSSEPMTINYNKFLLNMGE